MSSKKTDWGALQVQYTLASQATGVSVKDWCEQQGLKYQSARRYIKAADANKAKAKRKPRGTPPANPFQPGNEIGKETRFSEGNDVGKPNFKEGNTHGAATAKHGAYAKYFPIEVLNDVAATLGLPEELMLVRARIHSLLRASDRLQELMGEDVDAETAASILQNLVKVEQHLQRYIQQAESIERTLRSNDYTEASTVHKLADTTRVKEQAKLLKITREKLEHEAGLGGSPLSEAVREIQEANKGLLSA